MSGHTIWLETFDSEPPYIVPDSNGNYTPSVLAGFYMFLTMIILLQVPVSNLNFRIAFILYCSFYLFTIPFRS